MDRAFVLWAGQSPDSRRWLSVAGMAGAPMMGISLLLSNFGYIRTAGQADGLFSALYMAGFLSTAIGLHRDRVMGADRAGVIVAAVEITWLALAEAWALATAAGGLQIAGSLIAATDWAWPLSHLFMLVVGFAAWRAGIWKGWPVWMMMLAGCALPAAMAVRIALGNRAMILTFGLLTTVSLFSIAWKLGGWTRAEVDADFRFAGFSGHGAASTTAAHSAIRG